MRNIFDNFYNCLGSIYYAFANPNAVVVGMLSAIITSILTRKIKFIRNPKVKKLKWHLFGSKE